MKNWSWIILIVYFRVYFIVNWTDDLAYLILMFSLRSWFLYFHGSISCSTCTKSTKGKKPYGNSSIQNGHKFFISFWKKYYFIQKLKFSYYNNLFGNVFQTSGVIGLITKLYVRHSDAKKVFHWKPGFTISKLFPWFSVFSLFKLM